MLFMLYYESIDTDDSVFCWCSSEVLGCVPGGFLTEFDFLNSETVNIFINRNT